MSDVIIIMEKNKYLFLPVLHHRDAGKHGKRHAIRAHKPQAVSDWLNPHSFGTMSAFGCIENLA